MRLSYIYKRQERYEEAIELWEEAARLRHLEAHVELAKYYEHKVGDLKQATIWTTGALELLNSGDVDRVSILHWEEGLQHRLMRLRKKSART
jgi:hypothetical protein